MSVVQADREPPLGPPTLIRSRRRIDSACGRRRRARRSTARGRRARRSAFAARTTLTARTAPRAAAVAGAAAGLVAGPLGGDLHLGGVQRDAVLVDGTLGVDARADRDPLRLAGDVDL